MSQYSKIQFGWEGDNGLGERLIEQIITGKKTATCAPIFDYTAEELQGTFENIGKIIPVLDKDDRKRCTVEVIDVFKTTFGKPDPRLLSGEGYENDTSKFKEVHQEAWKDWLVEINETLNEDTVLIVELFRFKEVGNDS